MAIMRVRCKLGECLWMCQYLPKYCQTGMDIFVCGGTDKSNRCTSWSSAQITERMKAWLLLCCLFICIGGVGIYAERPYRDHHWIEKKM